MTALLAALLLAAPPCGPEPVQRPRCAGEDWVCLSPAVAAAEAARVQADKRRCDARVQLAEDIGAAEVSVLRRELETAEDAGERRVALCLGEVERLTDDQGYSGWAIAGWAAGGLVVGAAVGSLAVWLSD